MNAVLNSEDNDVFALNISARVSIVPANES